MLRWCCRVRFGDMCIQSVYRTGLGSSASLELPGTHTRSVTCSSPSVDSNSRSTATELTMKKLMIAVLAVTGVALAKRGP